MAINVGQIGAVSWRNLVNVWTKITNPSSQITDDAEQRRARLATTFLLVNLFLELLGLLISVIARSPEQRSEFLPFLSVIIPTLLAMTAIAYVGSRTPYYKIVIVVYYAALSIFIMRGWVDGVLTELLRLIPAVIVITLIVHPRAGFGVMVMMLTIFGISPLFIEFDLVYELTYRESMLLMLRISTFVVIGSAIFYGDLHQIRKQSERIRTSENRLSQIASRTPGAVYHIIVKPDDKLDIVFMSVGAKDIYGLTEYELKADPSQIFEMIDYQDRSRVQASMKKAIEQQSNWIDEYRIIRGGREYWLRINASVVTQNRVTSLYGITTDITLDKQRQARLETAITEAKSANVAKTTFIANMSHELRTPLNAILGFTQVMQRDTHLTQNLRDNLDIINSSGEHLLELINDVLEMSKIEAGSVTYNPTALDLTSLLDDLEKLFNHRAQTKGLKLTIERPTPQFQYIRTDQRKLRQILINLLSNAIKFTSTGEVSLQIHVESFTPIECVLRFDVRDTGTGIGNHELDGLFDAFVQTESGRRAQQGTGLGLPISKRFANLMGGDLTVTSEFGRGSVFTLLLHAEIVDESLVVPKHDMGKVLGVKSASTRYKILIAEDQLENRLLMRKVLEPFDFEIRDAYDGQQAIDIHQEWYADLIWMDMQMPNVDGYQATRQIKTNDTLKDTIIIALTASAFDHQTQDMIDAGCDDFVSKPFTTNTIYKVIERYLDVELIYEHLPIHRSDSPLDSAQLSQIPSDQQQALFNAVSLADYDMALDIIEELSTDHKELAEKLRTVVNDFQFDIVVTLLDYNLNNT